MRSTVCFAIALLTPLVGVLASPVSLLGQRVEEVYVLKAMDDHAVIVRQNGEAYLIEKGIGCLSLGRLEGRAVSISSRGLFLGIGSRLTIPDRNQDCRIREHELIGQAEDLDCYESSILNPTPFMGNNGEIFRLADGSIWEVKYEYEYMYEYYPSVLVCPTLGKLIVDGEVLNVQKLN